MVFFNPKKMDGWIDEPRHLRRLKKQTRTDWDWEDRRKQFK